MTEPLGLMCVHAHPDDEAISTGGVLARAADEGRPTAVVTCTGGEHGEIVGEGLDPDEVRPRLADLRRDELTRALAILGAGPPRFLGYVDSGMMGTPENAAPESFWQAPFDEAVGRLVAHIRRFRPAVLVTYDAYGGYGHPDHIQAHRVTVVAAEAAAWGSLYPEAGPPWRAAKVYLAVIPRSAIAAANRELVARGLPSPFGEEDDPEALPMGVADDLISTRVDVGPWLGPKQAALRAHYSQLGPDSFFLNVPEDLVPVVFATEWFQLHRSDVPVRRPERDLFAGLAERP